MAQAASTALPPCSKIRAPAVAPSGFPVMATQCRPCRTGLCVAEYGSGVAGNPETARNTTNKAIRLELVCMVKPDPKRPAPQSQQQSDAGHVVRAAFPRLLPAQRSDNRPLLSIVPEQVPVWKTGQKVFRQPVLLVLAR